MDTLNKLIGTYEGLQSHDNDLTRLPSKTPQPIKRKFSEDVEKKIEPLRDRSAYLIGVKF